MRPIPEFAPVMTTDFDTCTLLGTGVPATPHSAVPIPSPRTRLGVVNPGRRSPRRYGSAVAVPLTPPPDAAPPERNPAAPGPGSVLPPHYAACFGCGPDHPTGLHLSVTVAEGVAVDAVFNVAEAHQGAPGLAHGGVLATAADEALGFLNWLLRRPAATARPPGEYPAPRPAVTARLEFDSLRPVPVGSDLHLRAECTAVAGRKTFVRCEGRLDAPDGPAALRATGLFIAVPLEHFRKHAGGRPTTPGDERSYNP